MARLGRALAIAVLLLSAIVGIPNFLNDLAFASTALQKSVLYGILLYSVLGLAAAAGVVAGKRWAMTITAIWGMVIVFVASVASAAFGGGEPRSAGSIGAGIGAVAIAGAVFWGVAKSVRPAKRAPASTLTAG